MGLLIIYLAIAVFAVVLLVYQVIFIVTVPKHLEKIADCLDDIAEAIEHRE